MSNSSLKDIRKLIADYHEYEGDKQTSVVKRIPHPDGGEMYLVHFIDAKGAKYSSLDMLRTGPDGDYITEFDACPRQDENSMIGRYLGL